MFKFSARRIAVAFSAVALCSAALLSPAGAANTAYEHRVDTDDDGIVDSREFAGRDRYATAVLLGDRYVAEHGNADTVIVASGVSQVDAVAAAALSSAELAPVLLTYPDLLAGVTADWIDDNDILDVIIVGGTAAVSQTVEDALAGVGIVDTVRRISGDDRYETAALIADETAAGAWCDSSENTAFVVTGTDIDAAAIVAPASAAMGIPVLLADSENGLPDVTTDVLNELDVERAILVSTDGPQPTVTAALESEAITVTTVTGDTATASVAFAELLTGDCADEGNINLEAAALTTNSVDALAAGLSLSDFAHNDDSSGGIVPVLFADKHLGLSAAVRDWLAATPAQVDGDRTDFAVIALGGTAAVPASLVAAAVNAASAAPSLTATIENVTIGEDGSFDVLFSENVDTDAVVGGLAEIVEINGIPLYGVTPEAATEQPGGADCDPTAGVARRFTVTGVELEAGDTIAVVSSPALFGAEGDQRTLTATSHRVRAERAPSRPSVTVTAIAGQSEFWVDVNKPGTLLADEIDISETESGDNTDDGLTVTVTTPDVALTDGTLTNGGRIAVTVSGGDLVAGDRIVLASGAFDADDGSASGRVSRTVVAPDDSFEATRVDVAIVHTAQASVTFGGVTVAAAAGGSAAGAHGNDWTVQAWDAYDYDPDADTASIEVVADPRHQVITVKYLSGTPTVADIVDAVNSVPALRGVIEASAGCGDGTDEVDYAGDLGGDLTLGKTDVVFSVVFSDYVSAITTGADPSLIDALDALVDDDTTAAPEGVVGDGTHTAPDATVNVKFADIVNADHIPDARSVKIPAGVVTGYDNPATTDVTEGEQTAETVRVRIR